MRSRGWRRRSNRNRKRSSNAWAKEPLPAVIRSSVTDGTTTTDSPSSLSRIAAQTPGIRRWSTSNRS